MYHSDSGIAGLTCGSLIKYLAQAGPTSTMSSSRNVMRLPEIRHLRNLYRNTLVIMSITSANDLDCPEILIGNARGYISSLQIEMSRSDVEIKFHPVPDREVLTPYEYFLHTKGTDYIPPDSRQLCHLLVTRLERPLIGSLSRSTLLYGKSSVVSSLINSSLVRF